MPQFKKKHGKNDLFPPQNRLLLIKKLGLRGEGPYIFIEGQDSYEEEYTKVCTQAKKEHHSLLRIIECDDTSFYDMDSTEQLRRFNLDGYTRVLFKVTDDIDFAKDEMTSPEGIVNDKKMRQDGPAVTGFTTILEKEGKRNSVIFMRRDTGDPSADHPEIKCATKISALLHEIGHVDDFEKSITFRGKDWRIVDAEVYAHQFACRSMFGRNYMLVLEYYLDGLKKMIESSSEYVKRAATRVVESADYTDYRAAIAMHKEKMATLKPR